MELFNVIQQVDLSEYQDVDFYKRQENILLAMIPPILFGLLVHLKHEVVKDYGTISDILLRQLARNSRDGFGDCGICFEYAVHSAIRNNNPLVMERIQHALSLCGVSGNKTTSILLGFEKAGVLQINNELENILTQDSRLIIGPYGESIKIKKYINGMQEAFRIRSSRSALPLSISDMWRADLFIGNTDSDMWVATSVKINSAQLKPLGVLCIGIIPSKSNKERVCSSIGGMIICPLLHDNGCFMEYFYSAWQIVIKFLKCDARLPKESELPHMLDRRVAKYLESMRERPVLELIDNDLSQLVHPHLFELKNPKIEIVDVFNASMKYDSNMVVFAPDSLLVPDILSKKK